MTEDQKYSCQGCDRTDLTLTRNGKVRSHAANGKRVGPDNPACGMGSEYPKESTEFHRHSFAYGDDNHGHSGSFCECGMEEPDDAYELNRALHEEKDRTSVPPNPFRAPLPGGVFDNLPHDRQPDIRSAHVPNITGDQGVNAITSANPGEAYTVRDPKTHDLVAVVPRVPRSADDFLDDDSNDDAEDVADNGAYYWPAKYDGTCATCFAHFDEGDMIQKIGPGEYEAEECCGPGAQPQPERPKAVARTLPVVNGRYVLPHPETGKKITGGRASKYAEGIADSFMLDQWRHRMILIGLIQNPEIMEKVRSGIRDLDPLEAVKLRRDFLNARADEAMLAAGSKKRAEKGTKLHKYTEEVDAGQRELEDVPEDYRPDATAYRLALAECGFRPVKGLIERSVYTDELNVSGTFDRVLECIRDTELLDLDGRTTVIHAGEFVIGDVKSGDNIKSPWLEILIQEAIYAHAVNENGVAVQDEPGGPFRWVPLGEFGAGKVREDVGVVMHVPYGSGECKFYPADLITGWRGAQLCKANKEFWKIELPQVPFATFAVTDEEPHAPGPDDQDVGSEIDYVQGEKPEVHAGVPGADHVAASGFPKEPPVGKSLDQWTEEFRAVRTKEAANDLWRKAKAAGVPAMDLQIMVSMVVLDPKAQTARSRPNGATLTQPVQDAVKTPEPPATPADGRSLSDRARTVTTKAEASAVFKAINDKIKTLPEDERPAAKRYRDKLVKIMQDRLAAA